MRVLVFDDDPPQLTVCVKLTTTDVFKLLPKIDSLGQGTGIIESVLRSLNATEGAVNDFLIDSNVAMLHLGYLVSQTYDKLKSKFE